MLTSILLVMNAQYIAKIEKPGDSGALTRSAFLRWRSMVRGIFAGENIYVAKNEYPNPPVMAIILRPFAELPPLTGALAWFYAKVAMAVLAVLWCFRLVEGRSARPTTDRGGEPGGNLITTHPLSDASKAAVILFALPALLGDLSHNNVNIFILFLVAACLELYRTGRDGWAGLVLALAIACKVTPLLMLAYFGWKGAWKVVAGCLLGLIVWLLLVPGLTFGWDQNTQLLTDWYKLMVERPVLKGEITTERANQAIPGVVYRLLTRSPSAVEFVEVGSDLYPVPAAFHNIADLGRTTAWVIVKGLTAAYALLVMLSCRAPRAERQGWRFAAEWGIIVLGMLLFSERTWKHHAVTLIIPAAALVGALQKTASGKLHKWILSALVVTTCLMNLPGLFGNRASEYALILGFHTISFLLLATSLVITLLGSRRREPAVVGPDGLCGLGGVDGTVEPVRHGNRK